MPVSGTLLRQTNPFSPGAPEGREVTDINQLAPGQRILALWGGRWSPVDFVGIGRTRDLALVAYVGSATYRNYPHPIHTLRVVSDDVLEEYPQKYNDAEIPIPGKELNPSTEITDGMKLLGQAGEIWLPVEVTGIAGEKYRVHFEGFDSRWNAELQPTQLRLC